ncbi:substrate-binding domain-containing protein [Solidesulfovibrio sp.]
MDAGFSGRLAAILVTIGTIVVGGLLSRPCPAAAAETIGLTIPGTGDSEELLRTLAARFMHDNPDIRLDVPDSVGSTAGIRAVAAGRAELARTARPLREEEIARGLTETIFAKVPVVFAVHPSVTGLTGLTAAQALAVFSGTVGDWSELGGPALPIARVCRESPETNRVVLNAAIPGFESGGCRNQAVAYTTPEAVALAAGQPGAIGYFSLPAIAGSNLIPLAFDGVAPTPENLGRGTYPLTIAFALAYKTPLSPPAERFLKALAGPDARSLMTRLGCLPTLGKPAAP